MLREVADGGAAVLVVSSDFEELLGLCGRVVVMSDGTSIADLESDVLDETKLTLFAAPRSSMATTARLLDALAAETGGAAFWALLDGSRLFCLYRVGGTGPADPGFAAGATPRFEETQIAAALAAPSDGFVAEPGGSRRTLLVRVQSHRGHELGWIGVTVAGAAPPDAGAIARRVHDQFARTV